MRALQIVLSALTRPSATLSRWERAPATTFVNTAGLTFAPLMLPTPPTR